MILKVPQGIAYESFQFGMTHIVISFSLMNCLPEIELCLTLFARLRDLHFAFLAIEQVTFDTN